MDDEKLPSVAVAVAERGRTTCLAAFGWADRDRRIAATPSTMYSLASISKPFTATAVMSFVEQGALKLDDPANSYLRTARLRAFEGSVDAATLRRLLTHTAGLPLHYQFFYQGGPAVPSMDAAIAKYGIVVYPPGERYFYSNFGYGVLERILEQTAGAPYADVLRQRVLDPLGLSETIVSDGALDGTRAAPRYNGDEPLRPYTFDHVGASGVWSSARDLIAFGAFHLGHDARGRTPAVTRQTRRLMQRDHAPSDGPGRARGLGWGIAERDGWRQVAHTGGMPGVATILSLYPEADVAVVVLTNANDGRAVSQMERALAAAALPKVQRTSNSARPMTPGGGTASVSPPSDRDLASLAGTWQGPAWVAGEAVALELDVRTSEETRVRIGQEAETLVEGLRWNGQWLTAMTSARLAPTDAAPAASHADHRTTLTLARRKGSGGERLSGWATSLSATRPTYGAVSFAVELTKRTDTAR